MRLEDEVAIVTGSTRSLGRAIARMFAAEGAKVVISGRTPSLGARAVAEIKDAGGEATFIACDMTDEARVRDLVAKTVEEYGKLTILVNNAAPTDLVVGPTKVDGVVTDLTLESWNEILEQFLTGPFLGVKYAMPAMIEAGHGSIINMSSITSRMVLAGTSGYAAAKSGLHGLTRAVALDGAPHNVRCNCVMVGLFPVVDADLAGDPRADYMNAIRGALQDPEGPFGSVARSIQMIDRFGEGSDIAAVSLFLAAKESSFMTGMVLPLDGGAHAKAAVPAPQLVMTHVSDAS